MRAFGILILLFLTSSIPAQTIYGSLSGTVYKEETKEPIRIELKLFSIDSIFHSSVWSSENGKFNFIGIKKGEFYLKTGGRGNGEHTLYYSETIEIPKQSRINIALKQNPKVKSTDSVETGPIYKTINYQKK